MSEFDKLKDDAEQYAQQHPEEVQKGEQAVAGDLGKSPVSIAEIPQLAERSASRC